MGDFGGTVWGPIGEGEWSAFRGAASDSDLALSDGGDPKRVCLEGQLTPDGADPRFINMGVVFSGFSGDSGHFWRGTPVQFVIVFFLLFSGFSGD